LNRSNEKMVESTKRGFPQTHKRKGWRTLSDTSVCFKLKGEGISNESSGDYKSRGISENWAKDLRAKGSFIRKRIN